ncbi:MAG: carotenoid 1,2-hydratase [Rhodocyclaceae bacterium]|nr:carotenoid 1,2-hydratase [Rhodocyclaceae bacterium]
MRRICRLASLVAALIWVSAATAADFAAVTPDRHLHFPVDAGAHPAYRIEWWYVTGWLEDDQARSRGFQLTFFRLRTGIGEDRPGRFSPAQLLSAHAAVSDPAIGHLLHAERRARVSGRLAGASEGRMEAWIGDWRLAERSDGGIVARAAGERFAFDLHLQPGSPPMLNGDGGFSRKGPQPGHASYYYSLTGLVVRGSLRVDGRTQPVRGIAWLDHEWSSEYLPAGAVGWDWLGLNFDDGGALMAARMRRADGTALWRFGTLRTAGGEVRALGADALSFEPLRQWRSPRSGVRYPVSWRLGVEDLGLDLEPLMVDQELDGRSSTGAIYWEGAVRALRDGRPVGRGYLELTGYGEALRLGGDAPGR